MVGRGSQKNVYMSIVIMQEQRKSEERMHEHRPYARGSRENGWAPLVQWIKQWAKTSVSGLNLGCPVGCDFLEVHGSVPAGCRELEVAAGAGG